MASFALSSGGTNHPRSRAKSFGQKYKERQGKSKFFHDHHAKLAKEGAKAYNHNEHGWRFAYQLPEIEKKTQVYQLPPKEDPLLSLWLPKHPPLKDAKKLQHIHNANIALRSYNKDNNANFQLVTFGGMTIINESGNKGYYHYNILALSRSPTIEAGTFFVEVDANIQDEEGVYVCCIIQDDAPYGYCASCEKQFSMVFHPSADRFIGGHEVIMPVVRNDDGYESEEFDFD